MSRLPEIEKNQQTQIPSESVKAVCNMSMNAHSYIKCFDFLSQMIDDVEAVIEGQEVMSISKEELREAQGRIDPVLSMWIRYIKDGYMPVRQKLPMTLDHTTMYMTFPYSCMENGLVFREVTIDEEKREQLVLPTEYRKMVLMGLHNEIGNPGIDHTISLVKDRFYIGLV